MLKHINIDFWDFIILILIYGPPILSFNIIPMPLDVRYTLVTGMIKLLFVFGFLLILIVIEFNYDVRNYHKVEKNK